MPKTNDSQPTKPPMYTLLFGAFTLIILLIYPLLLNDIAFTKLVSTATEYNVFLMVAGKILLGLVMLSFFALLFADKVPKGRSELLHVTIMLCWSMASILFASYPDYLAYLGQLT